MATLHSVARILLQLAGFQSIREGMQAVMHDITVLVCDGAAATRQEPMMGL